MKTTTTIAAHPDAVAQLLAKTPVTSPLRTAEWADVPLAIRERAQFSAAVESARVMQAIQDKLLKSVSLAKERLANGQSAFVDRSSFIGDLRKIAAEEGVGDGTGSVTDISSRARLGLIYDMQAKSAAEFAAWKAGQSAGALGAFPAQELIRVESRVEERDWLARWRGAGGSLPGGRMIALKNDPIWAAISRFGTPWPPYDFGSGMGVQDIDRAEAEALGLLQPGENPAPASTGFNATLQASATGLGKERLATLKDQFGDQIQIKGDQIQWQGNLIQDLTRKILGLDFSLPFPEHLKKEKVRLGQATSQTRAAVEAAGLTLPEKSQLTITADTLYHILKTHSVGRETRKDQRGLTPLDIEMIPHIWRAPEAAEPGNKPRSIVLYKMLNGVMREVVFDVNAGSFIPNSLQAKK
jgi:hypothetical protein